MHGKQAIYDCDSALTQQHDSFFTNAGLIGIMALIMPRSLRIQLRSAKSGVFAAELLEALSGCKLSRRSM
jgi:hypothetical protein